MRWFVIAACILMLLGCHKGTDSVGSNQSGIKVLSTTAMIDDIVGQVGGERISHRVLITSQIDPHSYELVKGDDEKIDGACIVFFNGLSLEHGASLRAKLSAHPHAIALGDYILATNPQEILWEDGQLDPHIWMDVSLWAKIIDPIVQALSKCDPEGEEYYRANGQKTREKMLAFHRDLRQKLQGVSASKRYLVTSHDAFGYFSRAYLAEERELGSDSWRVRYAAPEGLAPDGQIGVIHLKRIIDHLLEYNIEVVFPESNISKDSLRKIVQACQEKHSCIRLSKETLYGDCMEDRGTYLGMLEHNAEVLLKEWK